ncbi:VOC family protein [Pararhodobacter oceanensis]|uniref:VOC family protein n=1 Tax=Pararhodobacter oceanensis TaxID=2172121 RepID=UPI003A93C6BD
MSDPHGTPIWYELITGNPDAVQDFYAAVMGWGFAPMPGGAMDYRVASAKGADIAGLLRTPPEAQGMPDMWFFYVGVEDVDAAASKVSDLGGQVNIPPTDIPGVGRFAFCSDPQGAAFYVMRGSSGETSTAFAPTRAGHGCWNELVTSDPMAALAFYGALFGWEHGGAMSMGPAGEYTFINHHGEMIGAVMALPEGQTRPYWNFALQVGDIDAAKAAVEAGGGKTRIGPTELPDDSGWLLQCDDPTGANIMFLGAKSA